MIPTSSRDRIGSVPEFGADKMAETIPVIGGDEAEHGTVLVDRDGRFTRSMEALAEKAAQDSVVALTPDSPVPPPVLHDQAMMPVEGAPPAPGQPAAAQAAAQPAPQVQAVPALVPAVEPVRPPDTVTISSGEAGRMAHDGIKRLAVMLREAGIKPSVEGDAELFSLSDNDLHPGALDLLFTALFGTEWWDWEPETLDGALAEISALGGGETSPENRTKLLAIGMLHVSTYPWVSMMPFSKTALAVDGRLPDFSALEPVYPGTLLVALQVMRDARPGYQMSHEVLRYIGACCVDDGLLVFPDPEWGTQINSVIARLCNHSVDPNEITVLESIWARAAGSGIEMQLADRDLDEVDESNLGDFQLSMAARAHAYAMDFAARKNKQLSSLAAWVKHSK